jgi:alpha-D-xyloside xylohydrolase
MLHPASPLVEFAAAQVPLFADPQREYHWVECFDAWERGGNTVTFAARNEAGQPLTVRLTFVEPAVLRVQLLTPGAAEPPSTPMLVAAEWPRVAIGVEEQADSLRLRTSTLTVDVLREPWELRVSAAGRPLYRQERNDRAFSKFVAYPFGYSIAAGSGGPSLTSSPSPNDGRGGRGAGPGSGDGLVAVHETFALDVDEHLYGLGGQYGRFDKRGQRHIGWLRETAGTNTTPVTYMEVPFFLSSRGYGIFVNHGERVTYELGYPSTVSGSFRVDAPTLDYFLIAGPDPKAILRRYTALTGRPALPPLWSLGVWMSRCMYRNRAEVEESVTRMREMGIPVDVYHLDPLWLKARRGYTLDACDFEWDEEAFGDPAALVAWLRERGIRLSLWENPYVWRGAGPDGGAGPTCEMYEEGLAKGYFARLPDRSPAPPLDNPDEAALIDYTNPAAVEWVKEKHRRWFRLGVACFKTDYGEGVPAEAVFHNGQTGAQLHNIYPLLYNRAIFEVSEEMRGPGGAIVFGRSGYAGSQRYPLQWSGDAQSTWGGMAGALRCGLSQAMSGIAFWTTDIGGFYARTGASLPDGTGGAAPIAERALPDPTLYVRWAQWGLLSSHSRFHGLGPREPWYFGEDAVRIVRDFARLRYRLLPYLWALAHEAAETGVPVLRPLALEYPDDPVAPYVETQYQLGPSLLVCPVFNPEGRCRVYLPAGRWHDWWDGMVVEGPRHLDLTVPLDRIPLFVRDGSILPLAPAGVQSSEVPWDPLELQVRGEDPAEITLWTPDRRVPVRADRRNDRLRVRIENAAKAWRVRLIGVQAREIGVTGAAEGLTWSIDGADTVAELTMTGQGSAQLTATLPE